MSKSKAEKSFLLNLQKFIDSLLKNMSEYEQQLFLDAALKDLKLMAQKKKKGI